MKATRPLSFEDYLEEQARTLATKGQRTRCRFKAAAVRILSAKGYHSLQMGDICSDVGLSQGAIYKYFANKEEIFVEVVTEFFDWSKALMGSVESQGDEYVDTYNVNLRYVEIYSGSEGLMRSLRRSGREIGLSNDLRRWWIGLFIPGNLAHTAGSGSGRKVESMILARGLAGMVIAFVEQVFERLDPDLAKLADKPEKVAEILTILWYRQAFAEDPPPRHVCRNHRLLAVWNKRGAN